MPGLISHGPLELPGLDPDQAQKAIWQARRDRQAQITKGGREVGQVMELCQWPFAQGDMPARTIYACVAWLDPSAARSDDLRLAGRRVRLLEG